MSWKRKGVLIGAAALLVALLARIWLPIGVKGLVNRSLDRLDGYEGNVEDVDIALWRGAYRAKGLSIDKKQAGAEQTFARIEALDISIEWSALLEGEIVSEVVVDTPVLNFVAAEGDARKEQELGSDGNWVETLRGLTPFRLNRFEVVDGWVRFRGGRDATLPELVVHPFSLVATNISNVEGESERLPSELAATGLLEDGSELRLTGAFDLFRDTIDMDMEFSCESINLPRFNGLLERYAAVDARQGELGIYSEWAVLDGAIDGYLKFVAKRFEVFDIEQDDTNPLSALWEAIAGFTVFVTKNKPEDQFASKIPFAGQVDDMQMGILPAIGSLLKNGFVQALSNDVEGTISVGTVAQTDGS